MESRAYRPGDEVWQNRGDTVSLSIKTEERRIANNLTVSIIRTRFLTML